MKTIEEIKARHETLLAAKAPWIPLYNQVGRYLHMRKDFYGVNTLSPAGFIPSEMFNTVAPTACSLAASALLGSLWPDGARSFEFLPADDFEGKDQQDVKDYWAWVTDRMRYYVDSPKSGFAIAAGEHANDQFSFGTTGFATLSTSQRWPVTYQCWDVKEMVIDEDADGNVDTKYRTRCMTVRRAVQEYPNAQFSPEVKAKMQGTGWDERIEIVHYISPRYAPRETAPEGAAGNLFMPTASIHYEKANGNILEESGFEEDPVSVCRLIKMVGWTYGWSSALAALPDILMLNAFHEAAITAAEKNVDPAQGVWDDSVVNGRLRTGAGEITVFQASGRLDNKPPLFPISTVGDMRGLKEIMELTKEAVTTAFFVDRLMDFNNEARMTAYEVHQRQDLRYKSLNMIFSRQENEWLVPTLERTFNILFSKKLLGYAADSPEAMQLKARGRKFQVIPKSIVQAIMEGRSLYRIKFRNSVTLMRNAEEISGIMTWAQTGGQMAAIDTGAIDPIHVDKTMKRLRELLGAHPSLERTVDEIQEIRDSRAALQQQQMQIEAQEKGAKATQSLAQARAMDAKSGGLMNPSGALPTV